MLIILLLENFDSNLNNQIPRKISIIMEREQFCIQSNPSLVHVFGSLLMHTSSTLPYGPSDYRPRKEHASIIGAHCTSIRMSSQSSCQTHLQLADTVYFLSRAA